MSTRSSRLPFEETSLIFLKRKARGSSTNSETLSPERARVRVDQGSPEEGEDIVDSALNMAQEMGEKLDLILRKLAKLEDIEQKVEEINERFKKKSTVWIWK